MGAPPYTGSTETPDLYFASLVSSPAVCIASSRVGHSTSACTVLSAGSSFSMSGMPNAAVLPVPVCAWPMMSFPSSMGGMDAACIGVAST